ncbi:uncharacterized protein LOC143152867 [Ptiloglossa arizonensis]|uniref:uncharacterized protein LOC143152867 n=1 Tax=Ptiloglossa arizonensis TaxID=3350558 RepID=UPI003FA09793
MNEKCSMNRNLDIVSRNKPTVSANRKIGEQFSFVNYGKNNDAKESILKNFHREESVFRTNDEHRRGHRDENYVHSLCGELSRHSQTRETDLGTNENYERERFHNCSSFDPNRAPVKLDNRRDSFDSCILRTSNTLERIFTNSKEECDVTPNGRLKKKRQRSFKDFLGSMVGWKKSETKEKPRRFMSCEHLMKETKTIDSKNVKVLSRASSLKAVNEDNWIWIGERQAMIRPIYGRKRTEQLLETLARNKKKLFGLNESVENLVKPSAIKDIVKHLSQIPENSQTNNNFCETERRSIIEKRY